MPVLSLVFEGGGKGGRRGRGGGRRGREKYREAGNPELRRRGHISITPLRKWKKHDI